MKLDILKTRSSIYSMINIFIFTSFGLLLSCKPMDSQFSSADESYFDEQGTRSQFSLGMKVSERSDLNINKDTDLDIDLDPVEASTLNRSSQVYISDILVSNQKDSPYISSSIQVYRDVSTINKVAEAIISETTPLSNNHLAKNDAIVSIEAYSSNSCLKDSCDDSKINLMSPTYNFGVSSIQEWGVAMDFIMANETIAGITLKLSRGKEALKTELIRIPKLRKSDVNIGNFEGRCLVYTQKDGKKYPESCSLVEFDLYCKLPQKEVNKKVLFESRRACVINKNSR